MIMNLRQDRCSVK